MSNSAIHKVLARSVQDRAIEGLFFAGSATTENDSLPTTLDSLVIGVFHGDEGISGQLLDRIVADWQAGRFQTDSPPDFKRQPVLVIPTLNPDGLAVESRVNANGVDLNRNYPTPEWQEENQDTPYYSGKAPASEPETRLVIDLIERYKPRKIITVHSPYKVINFDGPARALADAMAARSGYAVVEDIGYPTPGSFGTYAGKIRQIPVITLELPEDESLEAVWHDNAASLEVAVRFEVTVSEVL
jgi:murein peptide amidase A